VSTGQHRSSIDFFRKRWTNRLCGARWAALVALSQETHHLEDLIYHKFSPP